MAAPPRGGYLAAMRWVFGFGAGLVAGSAAAAPCPPDLGPPAVHLLTFSPGTSVHSTFGHTALLLYEPLRGERSWVYDFGHFDASDPIALVWGIANADQDYHVGRQSLEQVLQTYGAVGRGIVAQQLALRPEEAQALAASLEDILAREASFPYNWFQPNCTTRVRDLVDQTLDGRLFPQHQGPSGTSSASEVLRHSAHIRWLWFVFHWGAGRGAYREYTHWESTFLPIALKERIGVSEIDGRPLVASECELLPERLPPIPDRAPNRDPALAALGLGAGAGLLAAGRIDRRLGASLVGLLGLVAGLFGTAELLLGILGAFAPAWAAHNMPFASPLNLGLLLAAAVAWRRPESRLPLWLAGGVLAVAAAGVGLLVVRLGVDRNLGIALGALPLWLAAAWVLRPDLRRSGTPDPSG